ncbi:MAG: chitobiase/beta-hexosaminidase C-terminal domain-containing protein, partial [Bacteroidaceae bacterium]|nr:chitobiase/beta-hexosaminidase C-terminal domain-containing protein [Bacteroidaceae bacterium]
DDDEEDDKDKDKDKDKDDFPNPPLTPSIDPAGYVYEGVSSNRVEGVTATCYYKETVEDMYGDLRENIVLWNAEEYAQENPLFTDENGMYQWFVPQGLWQVKFEKEGYETTYSEWLPVPPPQLEVNIPIVQNKQPEVVIVHAYEDGIVVEFDKYMQPATLNTSNIFVVQNGEKVDGTVVMLNEEIAYRDSSVVYVSKVRFVFDQPITAEELTLTVSNRVKSYAGIQMQDTYTQTFDIEKEIKAIVADSLVSVFYGGEHTLAVKVTPADAAAGKTLVVTSSSPMILAVVNDSITLDSNGEAMVTVRGELPGSGAINYSIAGYDYTATTIVKVEYDNTEMTANPTASIPSGTTVTKGTEVTLSCATEGAVIYYTLDGSCPCDEATQIRYDGTHIIINSNTELRMMAVAEGRYESDVVVYYYYVEGDVQMTANPTASIASGTTVAKGTEVTLSCATEGAVIYYTLDGSSPDDAATQIRYDGTPIVINETTTLRMMAVAEGYEKSYIVEYHYYVEEEVKVTAAPTASIASGTTVAKGTEVTLNCATEGAVIYYTLDGSSPDDVATQIRYDGTPIVINETTTLRMLAVAEGYEQSYIVEYRYYVEDEEEPKPMEVTIHQKWDDVLICDNSSNEFVAYQWYKNDMPIAGETRQYYSEVDGLNGSYYVMAQNINGDWGMSNVVVCAGRAEIGLKVTPSIVKKNEKCVVSIHRAEGNEEVVYLNVYNAMGQMVRRLEMTGSSVELELGNPGPYFIKAVGLKNNVESEKIMVIE